MSENLEKIDVAGLKISPITKTELLKQIAERIKAKQKTFVCTPYSEFLYASFENPDFRQLINTADFAIADGVGILWAKLFLRVPLTLKYFYLNILQAWWQVVWTGASILLQPSLMYKAIPEKIVGADLIWDLAGLAEQNQFTVYLLGGRGVVAELTAKKLRQKFPNLKIVGTSNKEMDDESILADLTEAKPDMLFVAFKAQAAEQWIAQNLPKIPVNFAIALGGTFDYVAGFKMQPPKFVRSVGLEWLYRLITQPSRIRRIFNATWGMVLGLVRYKVYASRDFRANGAAVVINKEGKILLCRRVPGYAKSGASPKIYLSDYWQFPQGGLEKNEDPILGTQRELREETGITSVEVIGEAKYKNSYTWNNATRRLIRFDVYPFQGQIQVTVFFKFTGDESEVKLDQRELVDFVWLSPEDLLRSIHPERRPHAEIVLAELAQLQV